MIAVSKPYNSQDEATQAAAFLENTTLVVTDKRVEILEEAPSPPYTTATFLEDATKCLRYDADQIMHLAQLLFEGVELYGFPTGLITYHRTESIYIASEAKHEARVVIEKLFGKSALPERIPINQQSSINNHKFQQSHEAIRPTSPKRQPDSLVGVLGEDELALYRLIWERFIASQMKAARYRVTTVELEAV